MADLSRAEQVYRKQGGAVDTNRAPLKSPPAPALRYLIHINEAKPTARIIHSTSRQAQEVTMPMALPWQRRRPSLFAHILAWCNDRVSANAAQGGLGPSPARDVICDARWPDQAPDLARHSYDAGLLFRRMAALQIDRDELASDDPLLFRELQGLCTLCRSKERCVLDLAQERDQPSNPAWREYCPNAATLNVLGAVQNCSRAARHLKTPHSTGHLG